MARQALWHPQSWQKLAPSMLLVLAIFYLGFHAISGDRGLYVWLRDAKRLEKLQTELANIKAQRQDYEQKIRLLKSDSINLDMLDEQARRTLGFVASDEVVVMEEDHAK